MSTTTLTSPVSSVTPDGAKKKARRDATVTAVPSDYLREIGRRGGLSRASKYPKRTLRKWSRKGGKAKAKNAK